MRVHVTRPVSVDIGTRCLPVSVTAFGVRPHRAFTYYRLTTCRIVVVLTVSGLVEPASFGEISTIDYIITNVVF